MDRKLIRLGRKIAKSKDQGFETKRDESGEAVDDAPVEKRTDQDFWKRGDIAGDLPSCIGENSTIGATGSTPESWPIVAKDVHALAGTKPDN